MNCNYLMEVRCDGEETIHKFHACTGEERKEKAKQILAQIERKHRVSDRYVRATVYQEVERW